MESRLGATAPSETGGPDSTIKVHQDASSDPKWVCGLNLSLGHGSNQSFQQAVEEAEVVVWGATPGGIGAALAAARRGRRTLLLEPGMFIGGMMTSGLGRTDVRSLESTGSVFREFAARVLEHYASTYGPESEQVAQCNRGLWFEPSVAKKVFRDMLAAEVRLEVRVGQALVDAKVEHGALRAITVRPRADGKAEIPARAGPGGGAGGGAAQEASEGSAQGASAPAAAEGAANARDVVIRAGVFIDASYEGDLAALSGVPYVLGREGRDEWNEEFAGKLYMDFSGKRGKEVFPGSTGEGDDRIQAYNFRLCLTQDPANRVPVTKPPSYRRQDYVSLIEDVREGRVRGIGDVMNMLPIPNGKTDSNNHHYCMCSTDLPEENGEYPEGDEKTREKVIRRHREYIQGLLWFLQNDPELPESSREEARRWGYAADEFVETEHFPPQIYVREARRIRGEYVFSENDARVAPGLDRAPIHFDSVAVGDYAIDSHATRKREPEGRNRALEGFLGLGWLTEIYQIPYRVMVPRGVDGLLVPVAVSATHMGYGTIRMEPCWMQLGYAAGVAADLALRFGTQPRHVPVDTLQDELLMDGQRITFFSDIPWDHKARPAAEYLGAKGFFTSYKARLDEPLWLEDASRWIALARMLPGGAGLPPLPASDRILPVGVDMGPRFPYREIEPRAYWAENPLLKAHTAGRWLAVASRALGVNVDVSFGNEARPVTRGEFCDALYRLLLAVRRERGAIPV